MKNIISIIGKTVLYAVLFLFFSEGKGQSLQITDSLRAIYWSNKNAQNNLDLINEIARNEPNPDTVIKFSNFLIKRAANSGNFKLMHRGYLVKGNAFSLKGDYQRALKTFFESLKIAEEHDYAQGTGRSSIEIGNVYSLSGNNDNADIYYNKGLEILRESNDSLLLGRALFNAGDEYLRRGDLEKAEKFTLESEHIFKQKNFTKGQAYSLGNLGRIMAKSGNDEQAVEYLNSSIELLKGLDAYDAVAEFLLSLADIYSERGENDIALEYANRSLEFANAYGFKNYIADANLKLSQFYENENDAANSFKYYKDYITYRDSFRNVEAIREMADLRTNYEISQKQNEVDLLNQQKRNQRNIVYITIATMLIVIVLAIGLYRRNNFIKRTNSIIEREKNRSDQLLLNILPVETAAELKETGKVQAKRFENISVLFTDFQGFTHYAENLSPEELVASVDFYFSEFDKIIEKYHLEKIKTVGDSYMCAAGVPYAMEDHAVKLTFAALDIARFVKETKKKAAEQGTSFEIRIGINSGPVIAGVVGSKKFIYDIWGDTVNIASRMESCSAIGKVNVSESTYEIIKNTFDCEYRGEMDVKNKGKMKMYFVIGEKV